MKQTAYALIALVSVIVAAGAVESSPLISVLALAVMAVCIARGKLWKVKNDE